MSVIEDLINFDIIEEHKENIQSLPGGRSAKSLASTFAPTSLRSSAPTPGDTRNLNDAIREEYELELAAIGESDDPLDIYDRYVKWTFGAYPSAQATPESRLRPLLERATKAFQSANHYKNDPRYLKLWLNYIRFFSDAPRETFTYLARHNIGEGLALFYEEFAAWLEGAGRWMQAEEVYRLGIEREARPAERLIRKFGQFQQRFECRVVNGDEPSSPALPTVRPALVAKIDPFVASTPRQADPQAPRLPSGIGGSSTSRPGRQKLSIFSDTAAPVLFGKEVIGDGAKGWANIGTIEERKKENVIEARPWKGETLNGGRKTTGVPKMTVFKDESSSQKTNTNPLSMPRYHAQSQIVNPQTGKIERAFANLEAVYPNDGDPCEEMSFEELRAKARGWLGRDWAAESKQMLSHKTKNIMLEQSAESLTRPAELADSSIAIHDELVADSVETPHYHLEAQSSPSTQLETTIAVNINGEAKTGRPKRMRIKEVKGETQTIKANLESPTGPKMRRKNSAEPTMTLHTKAATDDILDIFSQPLRNVDTMTGPPESDGEIDYDEDDYTSAGESTGTGRISGTSDFGDTEPNLKATTNIDETIAESVSPWSDFTASRHVPKFRGDGQEQEEEGEGEEGEGEEETGKTDEAAFLVHEETVPLEDEKDKDADVVTSISCEPANEPSRTRYVPLPPEDYEPPARFPRDAALVAQNKLPFMTPIIEKTENSLGALSIRGEEDYFNSKTPSRQDAKRHIIPKIDGEPLSSPFQEIINEARPGRVSKLKISRGKSSPDSRKAADEPIIKDTQCNPVDESIRNTILEFVQRSQSSFPGYHDHRPRTFNKGPEIRKYIKALVKSKTASDKTTTSLSLPPTFHFPNTPSKTYTIKRELGKGAFAPVYLAECSDESSEPARSDLIAIKCEDPPTAWEYHIMTILQQRLPPTHRANASLLRPHALHLFGDEAYLLESYQDQGTLLDLINAAKSDPMAANQTTLDESIAMFFTVELLRTVEAMHAVGILHGDLKADNCLVRLSSPENADTNGAEEWDAQYCPSGHGSWSAKGLTLIDFGRSIDLTAFRPDVQFIADWAATKEDPPEIRDMRPWTYQIDYWGVAGVVHSLLFGKYIEDVCVTTTTTTTTTTPTTEPLGGEHEEERGERGLGSEKRYKIKEGLKRYWQTELWGRLFEVLLNPGMVAGGGDVGARCGEELGKVREAMESWLGGEGGRRNGGLRGGLRRLAERTRGRRLR